VYSAIYLYQFIDKNHFVISASFGRVIGGTEAKPHQFPWLATVICLGKDPDLVGGDGQGGLCTGSFITPNHVLTAAHCVYGCNGGFEIYAATHNRSAVHEEPDALVLPIPPTDGLQYQHPNWLPTFILNDVGVIPLEDPVPLSKNVRLSCLPERRTGDIDYLAGKLATVTGWGKTKDSNTIPAAEVPHYARDRPIITNEKCKSFYGLSIADSSICIDSSGTIGICFGDSGGPLNLQTDIPGKYIQVGIASFVSVAGCESGDPHVFARVTEQLDFISARTGLDL